MADALLDVTNIETYYGPIMAIRGVSFSVREGNIVTILGANVGFGMLGLHLAVHVPGAQPAALAEPQRILDGDDERGEDAGEHFHRRARRP